jgi:hypothetical protein
VDYVNAFGWLAEEGRHDCWRDASGVNGRWRGHFRHVPWEDVLWTVEVIYELEIVDFSSGAAITVLPYDQVEYFLIGWHQSQLLKNSKELLRSDMKLLRSVKVHKEGLE